MMSKTLDGILFQHVSGLYMNGVILMVVAYCIQVDVYLFSCFSRFVEKYLGYSSMSYIQFLVAQK